MTAYADFQEREFRSEADGYKAVKHQEFVGTGYFDEVAKVVAGGCRTLPPGAPGIDRGGTIRPVNRSL